MFHFTKAYLRYFLKKSKAFFSLSAFVFYQIPEPNNDTIILNSITNLSRAKECLKDYSKIFLFLDNDSTGQKTAQELKQEFQNVEDFSKVYENHKDFNDFLTGL